MKEIIVKQSQGKCSDMFLFPNDDPFDLFSSALSLISTAVILGGFNSSDQDAFYRSFQTAAFEKDIRIARLQSIESLTIKDCMKKLLDQLIPEEYKDEKDKEFCDFDLQRLVVSRERELVCRFCLNVHGATRNDSLLINLLSP